MARNRIVRAALVAAAGVAALSCASTEYVYEGSGVPTDRASGVVPEGALGACRRPNTKRPPIVNASLWEHLKPCAPNTPASFVRLGYGRGDPADPEADKRMDHLLTALREGQKEDTGNAQIQATLRALREVALKDPALRDRVSKDPSRQAACDFAYLTNTMARERAKLARTSCAAEAYDPKVRSEACLFDTSRPEVVWLTSSWDCVTHTGALGQEQSCHLMCGYDDYCARQVSCAAADVDLLLCAMGVCLPEQRAGF